MSHICCVLNSACTPLVYALAAGEVRAALLRRWWPAKMVTSTTSKARSGATHTVSVNYSKRAAKSLGSESAATRTAVTALRMDTIAAK